MSDTGEALRRQIEGAHDLQSVVRTMKALAAASIGQYEKSVLSLADYQRTVELGLTACFREPPAAAPSTDMAPPAQSTAIGAVVFGSDQGLVGQFNEIMADFVVAKLATLPGKAHIWAVGERIHSRLADEGMAMEGLFAVPNSVEAITAIVGKIQIASETRRADGEYGEVHVFHNRPRPGSLFEPVSQRLLPLDAAWRREMAKVPWPTKIVPEVLENRFSTLRSLIRGHLFISLFRACAESLVSENASRLAGMQRAEKNIDDLLEDLHGTFNRLRQNGIDEELSDVVSGFNALKETAG